MKIRTIRTIVIALSLLLGLGSGQAQALGEPPPGSPQAPLGSAFTYQGYLTDSGGAPIDNTCDLRFSLWDALSLGSQIGGNSEALSVGVNGGYFTASVNSLNEFGASAFNGQARWLQVAVRCPAGGGAYTDLSPRQALTAAPYASYAPSAGSVPWSGLTGVPGGFADGVDNNDTYTNGAGLNLAGSQFSVIFAGSGSANSSARSDHNHTGVYSSLSHNHWGTSWSGSGAGLTLSGGTVGLSGSGSEAGVRGQTASATGYGLYGENTSSGGGIGVMGYSTGGSGTGVYGYGDIGLWGSGMLGVKGSGVYQGVYGETTESDLLSYAVDGLSASTAGIGVRGRATASSGTTYGVYGETSSTQGYGVYGLANGTSGANYGLYGKTNSNSGYGIYGQGPRIGVFGEGASTETSELTVGVKGTTASEWGVGVLGYASGIDYGAIGVKGYTEGNGTGVYGSSYNGYGTSGFSQNSAGVYGYSNTSNGVMGISNNLSGAGVYGENNSTSGTGYKSGVHGKSDNGIGVLGESIDGVGLYSEGNWGVYADGIYKGVEAYGSDYGVEAYASGDAGETYGVLGWSMSSAGYGGYFGNGGNGVGLVAYGTSMNDIFRVDRYDIFGPVPVFRVNGAGNVQADGGYHCGNDILDSAGTLDENEIAPCLYDSSPADFAEMLPASQELEPGEVLVVGPDGNLERSSQAYQAAVVGVYSTRPSYLGNSQKLGQEGYVPLAIAGIAPVKVSAENGPIQPGDLLVSASIPGHAMRCQGVETCFGRAIGKAMQPLTSGEGVILVLIILQ